ncbi:unnamed protein product, partial [Rotaria sp. Silwood2]
MISSNQYWNQMSTFDFDDLFSFPGYSNVQNEYDQYFMLHDDIIDDKTTSSSEVNDLNL